MPGALNIVSDAMLLLQSSGLADAATEIHCCFNGDELDLAKSLCPKKARITMHGLNSFAENLTIVKLWEWSKKNPGWNCLYFHAKGATHPPTSGYAITTSTPWRQTMLKYLVSNWRQCVTDLDNCDSVGCHFLRGMCDGSQFLWAGNYFWATSNFLATVPSMYLRERIKSDGIAAASSRYEAEVWIGNGKLPTVHEYLPQGGGGVP